MGDLSTPQTTSENRQQHDLPGCSGAVLDEVDHATERLRSVLASVSDCYFTLNCAYRITDLNEAARDWVQAGSGPGPGAHASGTCAVPMPSAARHPQGHGGAPPVSGVR